MKTNILFQRLSSHKTLKRGMTYARTYFAEQFDSPLLLKEVWENRSYLNDTRRHLSTLLGEDRYQPQRPLLVNLPKTWLFTRPGRILRFEDSSVLYSIAYLVAPRLDRRIPSRVYSARLKRDYRTAPRLLEDFPLEKMSVLSKKQVRDLKILYHWGYLWVTFQRSLIRRFTSRGYKWAVKLDLTGFFEHVDHATLERALELKLHREPKLFQLLMKMLSTWMDPVFVDDSTIRGKGLPQGHEISSFLANLYLHKVDERLEQMRKDLGIEWARYVDDIYIFGRDRDSIRFLSNILCKQSLSRLHLKN